MLRSYVSEGSYLRWDSNQEVLVFGGNREIENFFKLSFYYIIDTNSGIASNQALVLLVTSY